MDDQTPMPFGKHKDKPMEDVPADYLIWLWNHGVKGQTTVLHDYIESNRSALEMECKDSIMDPSEF